MLTPERFESVPIESVALHVLGGDEVEAVDCGWVPRASGVPLEGAQDSCTARAPRAAGSNARLVVIASQRVARMRAR